jgi:hypothetical protein
MPTDRAMLVRRTSIVLLVLALALASIWRARGAL